jgi:hypothetical protein
MTLKQILSVALALGSALVGGSLGAQALEMANAAPLSKPASSTAPVSASKVVQPAKPAPTTTARTDRPRRSTSRLV